MNPELQRQFWLKFTMGRAVFLGAILLGLAFILFNIFRPITAFDFSIEIGLGLGFLILFFILMNLLGTYSSAGSLINELPDNTWQQQRLSSMHPLTLMTGKLVGANALTWIASSICLMVCVWAVSRLDLSAKFILQSVFLLIGIGLLAQTASYCAAMGSMTRAQIGDRSASRFIPAIGGIGRVRPGCDCAGCGSAKLRTFIG